MDVSFWLYFAKWLHLKDLFYGWSGSLDFGDSASLSQFVCVCCGIAYAVKYKEFEKQGFGFNNARNAYEFASCILLLVWWTLPGPPRFAPADWFFCIHR
jgi:hypothetical protein